ncbi:hypothetical protein SLE2022_240010 [Rubroshorea leprosula]
MAEGNREHVALDVHLTSRYKTMVLGDSFISTNTCIFRVPDRIKMQNTQAYEPHVFSLGPWHFGKQHLMEAQKFKIYFLQGLVHRFPNPYSKVEELEQVIKDVQSRACECYGDWAAINVTKEEFEKILMLDMAALSSSCFGS